MIAAMAKAVAYGYRRLSGGGQTQHSSAAQEQAIQQYFDQHLAEATADGPTVYMECVFDDEEMLSIPFGERPVARKLLEQLRPGDHLIVTSLHAFRSIKDTAICLELFKARGISLHVIDMNLKAINLGIDLIDVGDLISRALKGILEMNRNLCIERTAMSFRFKRSYGLPMNGLAPLGWSKHGRHLSGRFFREESEREYARECVKFRKSHGSFKGWQHAKSVLGQFRKRTLSYRTFRRLVNAVRDKFPLPGGLLDAAHPDMLRDPKWKRKLLMADDSFSEANTDDSAVIPPISDTHSGDGDSSTGTGR